MSGRGCRGDWPERRRRGGAWHTQWHSLCKPRTVASDPVEREGGKGEDSEKGARSGGGEEKGVRDCLCWGCKGKCTGKVLFLHYVKVLGNRKCEREQGRYCSRALHCV